MKTDATTFCSGVEGGTTGLQALNTVVR